MLSLGFALDGAPGSMNVVCGMAISLSAIPSEDDSYEMVGLTIKPASWRMRIPLHEYARLVRSLVLQPVPLLIFVVFDLEDLDMRHWGYSINLN